VSAGEAGVAVAARSGLLPEVGEQVLPSARDRLAEGEHRVEVLAESLLVRALARRLVDEAALLHDVAEAVRHPRDRGLAVAPRAAGLLVVALDRLRQVDVRDEAHVGLVDAHAERDRRDHDDAVFTEEARLVAGAHPGIQPRVIRQGVDALRAQILGRLLDRLAAERVDDARRGAAGCARRTAAADGADRPSARCGTGCWAGRSSRRSASRGRRSRSVISCASPASRSR
jgi:hypothetical protein